MKNTAGKNSGKKTISEEELSLVKKEIADSLGVARLKLITSYPFIGTVAMSMNIVPVRDMRVRTMCTDGNTVYADCDFTASLSVTERMFVLAHEVWHACLTHMLRRQMRDPKLFNVATDKEINYLLKCDGFNAPEGLLYPEGDEVGKCAEEIYEMLLKDMKKNAKSNKSGKDKSSDKNSSSESGGEGLKGQFDKHIYDETPDSEQENSDGDGEGSEGSGVTDRWGDVGFDKDYRPRVSKDLADRMRETVIGAAQTYERQRGELPSHIASLVGNFLEPEINWREELSKFVTKCMGGGRRYWLPPNRRHVYNDIYLQSRKSERIKVAAILDTSGSTQQDMVKFVSELNGLVSSFGQFELTLVQCDAEVQSAETYSDENPFYELNEFEVYGGGGTYLTPGFEWLRDNDIEADCIVVFTDGYTEEFKKDMDPGIPVMWVLTSDGDADNIGFGTVTKFKSSEKNAA